MYVRWKRLRGGTTWYAQLVVSRRVAGFPRQKVLAHLASFDDEDVDDLAARTEFWAEVPHKLDELKSLLAREKVQRSKLEGKLAERVPRPRTRGPRSLVERACRKKGSKRERYEEAAATLVKEARVKKWQKTASGLHGRAIWQDRAIITPPPTTLRRFCVVAHECKHIAVGPRTTKHSYEREYECCRAEEEACRRFGFPFPEKELERNKKYVAYRLHQGLRRGLDPKKVKVPILRWCWEYLSRADRKVFSLDPQFW